MIAFLLIAALLGWIALIIIYKNYLEKIHEHVTVIVISNLVLLTAFSGLLMLQVMINEVIYWSFMIPLTINFAINIGYT